MNDLKIQDLFPKGKIVYFEIKIETDDTKALQEFRSLIFKEEGLPEGITCDRFWFPNQNINSIKRSIKQALLDESIEDVRKLLDSLEMVSRQLENNEED